MYASLHHSSLIECNLYLREQQTYELEVILGLNFTKD
jgi:hypothetical protein